jgi:tetratricopeptide (TPR) repeat protein
LSKRELTFDDKKRISDALLKVRALQDRHLRDLYLSELERQIGRSIVAQRYADAVHDMWSLINTLQDYPDGPRLFVRIIKGFHGETAAIVQLEQLLDELYPGSPLDALEHLVSQLAEAQVAEAFQDAFNEVYNESPPGWSNYLSILRRADLRPSDEAPPQILIFADVLAHRTDGAISLDLHRWVDAAGDAIGLSQDELRSICLDAQSRLIGTAHSDTPDVGGTSPTTEIDIKGNIPSNLPEPPGEIVIPTSVMQNVIIDRPDVRLIWGGGVPIRNPEFIGREGLLSELRDALLRGSKASVLPEALHGLGGVGKTQLAVEYVYRFASQYDLVWWISAEQTAVIRSSLAELGKRLGLPENVDMQQTAMTVLDSLGASPLRWLLVYDNADRPEDLKFLIPSAGGHVIVTSRNRDWATSRIGHAIEVDVFERSESVDLLRRRGEGITDEDADQLAAKLGDLPLALEQAATWRAATGMPVSEYLQLFDSNIQELMSEGQPVTYDTTVYAFLRVAFDKLRADSPAAAQLLELFAYLGAEPLSKNLLRNARLTDADSALAKALRDSIAMGRAIRELPRFGLAKVDPSGQRIQVHRLVQLVLRDGLRSDRRHQALTNVRELLESANPGEPDEQAHWPVYMEIGPHLEAADMISAPGEAARQVVLDHARYLFRIGDYESSRALCERAYTEWSENPELGPDHVQTMLAAGRLSNALRLLGLHKGARELAEDEFARMRRHPDLGEDHEYTLQAADRTAVCLRVAGEYLKAREIDEDNVERHLRVYGEADQHTLFRRNNLAVDLRMLGDFPGAYAIDTQVAEQWTETLGGNDWRTLFSLGNVARDLYGLGRYSEALEIQQRALPTYAQSLGYMHNDVLLCRRTVAIALRKTGQYAEALQQARDNYRGYHSRFGPDNEHTLATTMSYANALRVMGELSQATALSTEAAERYENLFGDEHPLTLAARVNRAIILRLGGDYRAALDLSSRAWDAMRKVLGQRHPFTLCASTTLTNDLVLNHDLQRANALSQETYALSRKVRGESHPYTAACAVNAAFDAQAMNDSETTQRMFEEATSQLSEVLGASHPEVLDAKRGKRSECDIEPPPT